MRLLNCSFKWPLVLCLSRDYVHCNFTRTIYYI
nr:MAG TPA: hypothetical protein [Bacteriophage sp.]